MYFEGLNSDFCNFMEEKVRLTREYEITDTANPPFVRTVHDDFYEVRPLLNYDRCISTNPDDNINEHLLILDKDNDTLLSFESENYVRNYDEYTQEYTDGDITYTLHYTYDPVTLEPAPFKKTANGNTTDRNGYYLDSEVSS